MDEEVKTLIFDIEKFAVHDGPGIRTVVFMKGCPLRCVWCHNPESQLFEKEIFFSPGKCIGCGWCMQACPKHCHTAENGKHVFHRETCVRCGKCAEKCYPSALETAGREMTVSQVMAEVMKDRIFYDTSGGGITLSGGEPLAHFPFTKALLTAAREQNLQTAAETCGYAPEEHAAALVPLLDYWLWDVKAAPEHHEEFTGVKSDVILRNLKRIDSMGAKIFLRCPLIPGKNDTPADLNHIAELANSLKNVQRIDLEPYHPLGESKNIRLGKTNLFTSPFAEKEKVQEYADYIGARTGVPVYRP